METYNDQIKECGIQYSAALNNIRKCKATVIKMKEIAEESGKDEVSSEPLICELSSELFEVHDSLKMLADEEILGGREKGAKHLKDIAKTCQRTARKFKTAKSIWHGTLMDIEGGMGDVEHYCLYAIETAEKKEEK